MAFADTSGTRLAFVTESTEGTTPASPSFTNLRFTGENLIGEKQTVTSQEIRDDGNVPDVTRVGGQVSGGFNFELTYATFDSILESVMCGTWATNVLVNGRDRKAFTFEKTFETGATDVYRRYAGCLVGSINLDIVAQQIVTGQATVMGRSYSAASAALSGATYAASNTKKVMNAAADFASLTIGSVSPALRVRRIQLAMTNNLRAQTEIGTDGLAGIGLGQFVVTGSVEAYLENKAILDLLDNHTSSSMTFTVGSVTAEKYTVSLPKLYMTAGDAVTPGNNQDVMVNMQFQAIYDNSGSPANDHTMKITRAVA